MGGPPTVDWMAQEVVEGGRILLMGGKERAVEGVRGLLVEGVCLRAQAQEHDHVESRVHESQSSARRHLVGRQRRLEEQAARVAAGYGISCGQVRESLRISGYLQVLQGAGVW